MSCLATLFLYFCSLRDVTDDVTGILLGHPRFSSITSNRTGIKSRERRHCHGTELPNQLTRYVTWPLSSIHGLKGCDLTLTSESNLTLTSTMKQKVYHSTWLDERITMVLKSWPCIHFCRSYEPNTKPRPLGHWPNLWGHRLTWNLKFGHQSLRLVSANMLVFFREA